MLPPALEGEASRPASVTAGRSLPPMDEAWYSQHPSMAEDRKNLWALKSDTSVTKELDARITQLQYDRKEKKPLTRALGNRPHL